MKIAKRTFLKYFPVPYLPHILLVIIFFATSSLPLLSTFGMESGNFLSAIFFFVWFFVFLHEKANYKHLLSFFLLAFVLVGFNTLIAKSCSPGAGIGPFLWLFVPPLLLFASLANILKNSLVNNKTKIFIALLMIVFYIGFLFYSWWQNPIFKFYSHVFILPSDITRGNAFSSSILAYRLLTLSFFIFLYFLNDALFNSKRVSLVDALYKSLIWLLVTIPLCLTISKLDESSDIKKHYSEKFINKNFTIKTRPKDFTKDQIKDVMIESLFWQEEIKNILGLSDNKPITIWLHKSNDEKHFYSGAQNVHFALPKHRQIHISYDSFKSVIGHEISHVLMGELTDTLLGLPGSLLVIPNLMISEGLAMALTEVESLSDDLSLMEQASGLYKAGIKPNMDHFFGDSLLQFAYINPKISYIYAGAFMTSLLKEINFNKDVIKQILKRGSVKKVLAKVQFKELMDKFLLELKTLDAKESLYFAAKFKDKRSILTSDCKKNKDLNNDPHALFLAGEYEKAISVLNSSLNGQNKDENNLLTLKCMLMIDDYKGAKKVLADMNIDAYPSYLKRAIIIAKEAENKNLPNAYLLLRLLFKNDNKYLQNMSELIVQIAQDTKKTKWFENYLIGRYFGLYLAENNISISHLSLALEDEEIHESVAAEIKILLLEIMARDNSLIKNIEAFKSTHEFSDLSRAQKVKYNYLLNKIKYLLQSN